MSLAQLVAASSLSWMSIPIYFIAYRLGNVFLDYAVYFITIAWMYIRPRFIQSFYIDHHGRGQGMIIQILEYIERTNPNATDRDHYPWISKRFSTGNYSIAPGHYIVVYQNKYVLLRLVREYNPRAEMQQDFLHLYTFSTNREIFSGLIKDAQKVVADKRWVYFADNGEPRFNNGDEPKSITWSQMNEIGRLTFRDTIIPEDAHAELEEAISRFNNRPQREIDLSIPHRLVILLSGPPGFGKTSVIRTIAYEWQLNIYTIAVTCMSDRTLPFISNSMRESSCLVLEDVDAITIDREKEETDGPSVDTPFGKMKTIKPASQVSLSGFLNMLDGVCDSPMIVILTTNYPKRLDAALLRAERIHVHLKFGPDPEVYRRMIEKFYPVENLRGSVIIRGDDESIDKEQIQSPTRQAAIESMIAHCMEKKLSTATLQSVFRKEMDLYKAAEKVLSKNCN